MDARLRRSNRPVGEGRRPEGVAEPRRAVEDAARKADRKQELLDWADRNGYALTEQRAARAVAADRVDALKTRLSEDRPGDDHDHDDRAHDRDDVQQQPKSLSL